MAIPAIKTWRTWKLCLALSQMIILESAVVKGAPVRNEEQLSRAQTMENSDCRTSLVLFTFNAACDANKDIDVTACHKGSHASSSVPCVERDAAEYLCISCGVNTFQDFYNNCGSCKQCTVCRSDQKTAENCTAESDTVCRDVPISMATVEPTPTPISLTKTSSEMPSTTSPHQSALSSATGVTTLPVDNNTDTAETCILASTESNRRDLIVIIVYTVIVLLLLVIIGLLARDNQKLRAERGKCNDRCDVNDNLGAPQPNGDGRGNQFFRVRTDEELYEQFLPENNACANPDQNQLTQGHTDHQSPNDSSAAGGVEHEPTYATVDKNRNRTYTDQSVQNADGSMSPLLYQDPNTSGGENSPETRPTTSASTSRLMSKFRKGGTKGKKKCGGDPGKGKDIPLKTMKIKETEPSSATNTKGMGADVREELSDGSSDSSPSSHSNSLSTEPATGLPEDHGANFINCNSNDDLVDAPKGQECNPSADPSSDTVAEDYSRRNPSQDLNGTANDAANDANEGPPQMVSSKTGATDTPHPKTSPEAKSATRGADKGPPNTHQRSAFPCKTSAMGAPQTNTASEAIGTDSGADKRPQDDPRSDSPSENGAMGARQPKTSSEAKGTADGTDKRPPHNPKSGSQLGGADSFIEAGTTSTSNSYIPKELSSDGSAASIPQGPASNNASDNPSTHQTPPPDDATINDHSRCHEVAAFKADQHDNSDKMATGKIQPAIELSMMKFLQRLAGMTTFIGLKKLCREMCLEEIHIDDVAQSRDNAEKGIELLKILKMKKGESLTYAKVIESLNAIGYKHTADKLIRDLDIQLDTNHLQSGN